MSVFILKGQRVTCTSTVTQVPEDLRFTCKFWGCWGRAEGDCTWPLPCDPVTQPPAPSPQPGPPDSPRPGR